MATTYGYGGEFSSDEDIDRVEQAERMVQTSKFNDFNTRPSAKQIEETIEAIKNLSPEEDINLSDDILASLLDHYKTQRGPIVDSTRKLYKKIVLRIIRDGSKHQGESNGNVIHNNNNNNNNDDVGMIISKQNPQVIDSFSSDDEEPLTPVIQGTLKSKFDSQIVVPENKSNDEKEDGVEEMDIDVQTPTTGGVGRVRETKQVDISSDENDDDDDDDDESSDESNSEELNSESDVLEVTPIKPPKQQAVVSNDKAKVAASALLSKPRQAHNESPTSKRQQPLAHSTPKESILSTAKKPYTRSQRARAVASNEKASDSFINSKSAASSSNDVKRSSGRRGYILLVVTLFVVLIAFLLYRFRDNILKSTSGGRQPLSISFG